MLSKASANCRIRIGVLWLDPGLGGVRYALRVSRGSVASGALRPSRQSHCALSPGNSYRRGVPLLSFFSRSFIVATAVGFDQFKSDRCIDGEPHLRSPPTTPKVAIHSNEPV